MAADAPLETPGYLMDPVRVASVLEHLADDGFTLGQRPAKRHAAAWYDCLFGMWCWLKDGDDVRLRRAWRICAARELFMAALDDVVASPFATVARSTVQVLVLALPVSVRTLEGDTLGLPRLDRVGVQ